MNEQWIVQKDFGVGDIGFSYIATRRPPYDHWAARNGAAVFDRKEARKLAKQFGGKAVLRAKEAVFYAAPKGGIAATNGVLLSPGSWVPEEDVRNTDWQKKAKLVRIRVTIEPVDDPKTELAEPCSCEEDD